MFSDKTYEELLAGMIAYADEKAAERGEKLDTREGSLIWYGQAPAAIEGQNLFIQMETVMDETFADTASREYLILRAKERGLTPKAASYAIGKAVFIPAELEIAIGERFNLDDLNYVVTEKIGAGEYRVQCETIGAVGNDYLGTLIPIEYVKGLEHAELTEILIPGEDEQETESFRKAYFDSFQVQAFGGNIADYTRKVKELQGVGGIKVYPVWNGGGTVKLVILDSTFSKPTDEMIADLQTAVDPETNHGDGRGIAPIGHSVTVVGVSEEVIDIKTTLTFEEDWDWAAVQPYAETAVDKYFLELSKTWEDQEEKGLIVRISAIEMALLDCPGVLDIENTLLNGAAKNVILDKDSIPIRGDLIGT